MSTCTRIDTARRARWALVALLGTTACGTPAADENPTGSSQPAKAASAESDIVGKTYAGYQGWFACQGDGAPANRWFHWAPGSVPRKGYQTFELWPDVREFQTTFATGYGKLGNGQPATLFSSWTTETVHKQVEWMKIYGIDGSAVQRFGSTLKNPSLKTVRDRFAQNVSDASRLHGRKFYIMYDLSDWTTFQQDIKADWTKTIVGTLKLTDSPAYARHKGKPVVNLWGMGFLDRPGDAGQCLEVINWFKRQGAYVIGGVPTGWRLSQGDSKPGFSSVYAAFDMVSPWTVGRFSGTQGVDNWAEQQWKVDQATCAARGQAYQPVVFPGFAWSNWHSDAQPNSIPRLHGDFLWRQFARLREAGIRNAYVAMFDEFDEGTAISKAAENASMAPRDQYFLTLDADGVAVSSDFYLRLVRDGARMLKGQDALTWEHPTPHSAPTMPSCKALGSRMDAKGAIGVGTCLVSKDGRFTAGLRSNRDFVVAMKAYGNLWATNTRGSGATRLIVQKDGNLVLQSPSGIRWSSGTKSPGAYLDLLNNGNLVLKDQTGKLVWSSDTCCR